MDKINIKEMNLKETSRLILMQVQHNADCGKDDKFTIEEIEDIVKRRVIDIFEPEGVYEKGKIYEDLGEYVGVFDTYPYGTDYFVRNHHFRIPTDGRGNPSKINKILIREIQR